MRYKWKLTDEEVSECVRIGCSVFEVEEAKKRAYIANGGVILNPDALEDMYEAIRWTLEDHRDGRVKLPVSTHTQLRKALAKADGK